MHLPVVGLYSSEQRVKNLLVRLQERAVQYIDNNVNKTQESDNPCKLNNIQPMKLRWPEDALWLMYQQS